MEVAGQYTIGSTIGIKGKDYIVAGQVGINGYLVVEKDADPEELADVKYFQVPWVRVKKK